MDTCLASLHLCRVRITRLDAVGNPVAGPNNVYVTDKPIQLGVTPEVEAGKEITLVSGCDCIVVQYRGNDKLKRWGFELDLAVIETAMFEMMTGAAAIVSGGNVIGLNWPEQINCTDPVQPNVCLEAWSDAWEDDHQADSPNRFYHWVWPSTRWQFAAMTLQNDVNQPKLMGFSRGNPLWGDGIFGDYPEAIGAQGGFFKTDTIPAAFCGYQTHGLS